MVGCKINSKMMPIITKLKNGDIVEIITSDNAKGPSRDWLKFVKSTSARNKIQAWFKKEQRDENIVKGKELIEKEIKRIGMSSSELHKQEYVQAALDRYKYNSLDDMYASVGFGAISAGKIIARILEEYKKVNKDEQIEKKIEELATQRKPRNNIPKSGIVVKGIDNCLVKLSKCCNPVPGDNIIGYITKGRGVSIHTTECVNIKDLLQEEDRIIDVEWYNEKTSSYNVDIEAYSNDRTGLLADIIKAIYDSKTKLIAVNSKINKERIVITEITVEVENLEDLNKTLKAIRKVDSVFEVQRKK